MRTVDIEVGKTYAMRRGTHGGTNRVRVTAVNQKREDSGYGFYRKATPDNGVAVTVIQDDGSPAVAGQGYSRIERVVPPADIKQTWPDYLTDRAKREAGEKRAQEWLAEHNAKFKALADSFETLTKEEVRVPGLKGGRAHYFELTFEQMQNVIDRLEAK